MLWNIRYCGTASSAGRGWMQRGEMAQPADVYLLTVKGAEARYRVLRHETISHVFPLNPCRQALGIRHQRSVIGSHPDPAVAHAQGFGEGGGEGRSLRVRVADPR